MDPASQLRGWGPDAAAAVVGSSGVIEAWGDTSRVSPIASVSKLLTGYALLVAIEEGTVALDEPAGPPHSTLRHLLAHASGLAFDRHEVLAPVGTRRIYSNVGIEVAASHLESAAALAWETYLTDGVLAPLGMDGVRTDGSPASGMSASVDDLARFAEELLSPALVSASTLAEATTAQFPALAGVLPGFGRQEPNPWGLAFEIRGHKEPHWTGASNSGATFGHFGGSGAFLWIDPALGTGLVAISGRAFGPWAVAAWPAFSDAVAHRVAGTSEGATPEQPDQ